MSNPLLLDAFCGAGGAGYGYHLAGFEVVGIDINPQPHYPFTFIQADALEFLAIEDLSKFSVIHASPPCQGYSLATGFHPEARKNYPDLIGPVRALLQATGIPYVIENVQGAPLYDPRKLCGTMFGLRVIRHRLFECSLPTYTPKDHCRKMGIKVAKPGAVPKENEYWCIGGHFGKKHEAQSAMGIFWMQTQREISEAIPPAYTEWIGTQYAMHLIHRKYVPLS